MRIDRLSAEDRIVLLMDRMWPQDVGALAILDGAPLLDADGTCRVDAVRREIAARLDRVPRFRQRIHDPGRLRGGPLWLDCPVVDLEHHVRVHPLPTGADEADLLDAVQGLRRQPLDPARPLWEMRLLPGLPDGRIGLLLRLHHVVADGRAAMSQLAALLDSGSDTAPLEVPTWRPAPPPSDRALVLDAVRRRVVAMGGAIALLLHPVRTARHLRAAMLEVRHLIGGRPASKTSSDSLVGPERAFALLRGELRRARQVARAHGATVNDLLLAITAQGLRHMLEARGEPVARTMLRIFVPVSLRGRLRGPQAGNELGEMSVPLPLAGNDPAARLARVAAATRRRKPRARLSLGTIFGFGPVGALVLKAVIRQRVNVTSASVPGPRHALRLAGAEILELFPVINLMGNQPLGVGAISYRGQLDIAITADRDTFPDLEVLAEGMRSTLEALGIETGREVALPEDLSRFAEVGADGAERRPAVTPAYNAFA
jgi:diacylglycerol O-acyltransferase